MKNMEITGRIIVVHLVVNENILFSRSRDVSACLEMRHLLIQFSQSVRPMTPNSALSINVCKRLRFCYETTIQRYCTIFIVYFLSIFRLIFLTAMQMYLSISDVTLTATPFVYFPVSNFIALLHERTVTVWETMPRETRQRDPSS